MTVTHIRDAQQQTYCGKPPIETISLGHYLEGLQGAEAQRGHVERLPAPLCDVCAYLVEEQRDLDRLSHLVKTRLSRQGQA